jgi:pimeloyl-ACP methyl ester carboxylesterase
MTGRVEPWTIRGAAQRPILGDAHVPEGEPRGAVLIAHGFKGYKDYGMFPRIARSLCARGLVAHRYNFSHSGMTNRIATFEHPDLFERDTLNKQVHDLRAVAGAVMRGRLAGKGLPCVWFGHSRGGVSVLLAAGRHPGERPLPAGLATASAPCTCNPLTANETNLLLAQGWLVSPSSRTGQALRIGKAFLLEQQEDPDSHDLLALCARIQCRSLIVHGDQDATVPVEHAGRIAAALPRPPQLVIVRGGDHVFNTPNPDPPEAEASPQLREVIDALGTFALECCGG